MPGAIWDPALAEGLGTRPDLYINFETNAVPRPVLSADGVIHVIAVADWGPLRQRVSIKSRRDVDLYLGNKVTNLRAAVFAALDQGVREVSFYRIAAAAAAKASRTLNDVESAAGLTVTAKYEGTFGNELSVEVTANVADATKRDVAIYLGTRKVEVFSGVNNDDVVADFTAKRSNYVALAVSGAPDRVLVTAPKAALTGGASGGAVLAADYSAALTAAGQFDFRCLVLDTTDPAIQITASAFVTEQRNGGLRITYIAAAPSGATFSANLTQVGALDSEATSYVVSGYSVSAFVAGDVSSNPDRVLDPVWAAFAVAAGISVAGTASVTNRTITNAKDVSVRLSPTEYTRGLESGMLILSFQRGRNPRVVIEQGLNTLQPATQEIPPRSRAWRKIRYIAIQDEFAERIADAMDERYKGKVENDERGHSEAVRITQLVLESMITDRLVHPGNPTALPQPIPTPVAFLDTRFANVEDRVFVSASAQAVDAAEKFFFTARF